ncbi:ATP-binding protein [Archangium gephyra]|uniref:ATP-binding protein n=1 Tax=Archangium gephyra TaxID=48 RepID=UPI0023EB206B|nr:ATP-binding protein [Archangium gephyra]
MKGEHAQGDDARHVAPQAGEEGGEQVLFYVGDTGPGIPPESLAHIFDRFWQANRTDRRRAGLGLSIAKGIVKAHGGRLQVESEPGRGSTLLTSRPARGAPASPRTRRPPPR